MDMLTATEQAYKNGYTKGYNDACIDFNVSYWFGDPAEGDIVCPNCGTLGPDNLPKFYLRHCTYCGQRLRFKEGE